MKNKRKAFSVAEATIALLIGSIALGMAAPMITKQIKSQNMTDTQFRVINSRNQDLLERINELEELVEEQGNRIQELENIENTGVPKGTIAFFDNTVEAESATNPCPEGWEKISSDLNGRFPRFAGSYKKTTWDKSRKTHVVSTENVNLSVGQKQEDTIRNITGSSFGERTYETNMLSLITGAFYLGSENNKWGNSTADYDNSIIYFDASRVVPVDYENRPISVALLGCRKI